MRKPNYKATGNKFHRKLERVLFHAGFKILKSDPNAKGPDIIAKFGDIKIIVQCKHSPNGNYYAHLDDDVDSYSTKLRRYDASCAVLALSGYKHKKLNPKELETWLYDDHVAIWNDAIIDNYKGLANSIKHFAAFQILGDLGLNEKFGENLSIPAIEVNQQKQKYFLTALPPKFLLCSAYVARRAQGAMFYQRYLSKSRISKEIPDYIEHDKGLFPNTLILVSNPKYKLNYENGRLTLPSRYACLWVVDGQHRLYSFCNIKNKKLLEDYELACTVFDGSKLDPRDQAQIFLKINTKAKKAPPPLLVELAKTFDFDFNSRGIYLLKRFEFSPYFEGRIKTYTNKKGTIDSNTFSMNSALNELIQDNGIILRGRAASISTNKRDLLCYQYIHSFFKVVYNNFRKEWNRPATYILSNNQGYRALLRLFIKILKHTNRRRDERQYRIIIQAMKRSEPLIRNEDIAGKYAGEGGAVRLADEWSRGINTLIPDFDPAIAKNHGTVEARTPISRGDLSAAESFLDQFGRRLRGTIRAELSFIDITTLQYLEKHFPQGRRFHIVFSKMRTEDKNKIDTAIQKSKSNEQKFILTKCEKVHERRIFDDNLLIELNADLKKDAIANSDHDMTLTKFTEDPELVKRFDDKWDYFKRYTGRKILFDWTLQSEKDE